VTKAGAQTSRFSIVVALALFAALTAVPVCAQDRPDFDHLARDTAAAIDKVAKGSPDDTSVLVAVFDEPETPASELAIELTKEFDAALRSHAQKFHVVGVDDLKQSAASHNLPEGILSNPPALKCSAPDLGLSVLVVGSVAYRPAGAVIEVSAVQFAPRHSVFRGSEVLPLSDSIQQLMSKRAPSLPPFEEKKVWVNPDHPPVAGNEVAKPKTGGGGNGMSACVYCPHATLSDDALWARAQGAIVLNVQVSADGYPSEISLIRGLPCGLTDKAFEAVAHWKFKPATDADGTPIAVVVPVEVTFRLY
jgi:hypothetical protein